MQREPEATAELSQLLAVRKASGHRLFFTFELGLLGEACLVQRRASEGLAAVQEALSIAAETGECVWQAELLRLQAELLGSAGAPEAEIETCFRQALDLARRQGAQSLALRAATGLARLWQRSGRIEEARQLLTPLYAGFTEGFDTQDLRAAHALLAVL